VRRSPDHRYGQPPARTPDGPEAIVVDRPAAMAGPRLASRRRSASDPQDGRRARPDAADRPRGRRVPVDMADRDIRGTERIGQENGREGRPGITGWRQSRRREIPADRRDRDGLGVGTKLFLIRLLAGREGRPRLNAGQRSVPWQACDTASEHRHRNRGERQGAQGCQESAGSRPAVHGTSLRQGRPAAGRPCPRGNIVRPTHSCAAAVDNFARRLTAARKAVAREAINSTLPACVRQA